MGARLSQFERRMAVLNLLSPSANHVEDLSKKKSNILPMPKSVYSDLTREVSQAYV